MDGIMRYSYSRYPAHVTLHAKQGDGHSLRKGASGNVRKECSGVRGEDVYVDVDTILGECF